MMRQRKTPAGRVDLSDETLRIERFMAAGWDKPEIAKGLDRALDTVDRRIRDSRGMSFESRKDVIASEVFKAAVGTGRSVGRIFTMLQVDEAKLHERLRNGASLMRARDGTAHKRLTADEAAATVTLVDRLMAVGLRKDDLAKSVGKSVGGLEKLFTRAAGTNFRTRDNEIALEVAEASIRAGRTTKQILEQLDIDETTLKDRLKREGVRLADLQERIKREMLDKTRASIREYLGTEGLQTPQGAEGRWQAINGQIEPTLYAKAFHHLLQGGTVTDFMKSNGIQKDMATQVVEVVLPTVRARRQELTWTVDGFLQPPVVTQKEKDVFRLVAVENKTDVEASKALGEDHAGITAIKILLLKKIPELTGLLVYHGRALGEEGKQ
ncbi:MAG: hypothetical protein PHG85_00165 [Candidatus Altiarchaeota archaeon]|nr:hypothetical protein [Candidatus Altiarchaeota archaeon]